MINVWSPPSLGGGWSGGTLDRNDFGQVSELRRFYKTVFYGIVVGGPRKNGLKKGVVEISIL